MATRDLTTMSVLDESALTTNMRAMLDDGVIYARSGQLLISLNPFRPLALYNEETLLEYRTAPNPASLQPHIYGVAAEAHARLIDRGRSQTIIISGESGTGKTENAKYVMQYLASTVIPKDAAQAAQASEGGALGLLSSFFSSKPSNVASGSTSLHERLLRSNPLLEAFGCARTAHNANSSRYGKFIELRFGRTGKLSECRLTTYLLEKSRVVSHGSAERSYTALYALCAGASRAERSTLSLAPSSAAEAFVYLQPCALRAGEDDSATMATVRDAFERLGVGAAEQADVLAVLAGVLHLGNVAVRASGGAAAGADAAADDESEAALAGEPAKKAVRTAGAILGLDEAQLTDGLLSQTMRAGAEWVTRAHRLSEAEAARDALAKALYARLFSWLVRRISESLRADSAGSRASDVGGRASTVSLTSPRAGAPAPPSPRAAGADGGVALGGSNGGAPSAAGGELFIGIIDIFGFEHFGINSLEQLLINYANEKLQRLFVQCVFVEAQRQYAEQGVTVEHVDFVGARDGEQTIALLDGRPAGVLPLLAEECVLRNGSDDALLAKLAREHRAHARFALPLDKAGGADGAQRVSRGGGGGVAAAAGAPPRESTFRIVHFAHAVDYTIGGFLGKNKDPLNQNLAVLLQKSKRPFLAALFSAEPADEAVARPPPAAPAASAVAPGGARVARSASFQRTTRRGSTGGGNLRFTGVADQFTRSLDSLMRTVEASDISFVRCFRPNGAQAALLFDEPLVRTQLASSGLLHAIQLARAAYPDSLEHAEVVGRYGLLVGIGSVRGGKAAPPDKTAASAILAALGVPSSQYAVGHTKAFFKHGVVIDLNNRRAEAVAQAASVVQRIGRGQLARRLATRARNAAAERARVDAELAEARRAEEAERQRAEDEAKLKAEQDELLRRAQEAAEAAAARDQAEGRLAPPVAPSPRLQVVMPAAPKPAGSASSAGARAPGVAPGDVAISFKEVMEGYTLLYATAPKAAAEAELTRAEAEAAARLTASGLLQRLGLRAPADELLAYARYLGMDPQRDWQLLWIADEALATPAPPGWEQQLDPTGGTFFQNVVTTDVSLQHPCDFHYQQLYYRERVQLLRQVAPHTLTPEDLAALPEFSTWRAVVLYPFSAEEAGEMSVRPGEVVTILGGEVAPEGWFMASFHDAVGLVPQTYVEESRTRYVDKAGVPVTPVHKRDTDSRHNSLLSSYAGGAAAAPVPAEPAPAAVRRASSDARAALADGEGLQSPLTTAGSSPLPAATNARVRAPPPDGRAGSPAAADGGGARAGPAQAAGGEAAGAKLTGEQQRKPAPKGCCVVS